MNGSKLTRGMARTVTERMQSAVRVSVKEFGGKLVMRKNEMGYVSRLLDCHTAQIRRTLYARGQYPRMDGYFLCVVRSTTDNANKCHMVDFYEFLSWSSLCSAYDFVFCARKNA